MVGGVRIGHGKANFRTGAVPAPRRHAPRSCQPFAAPKAAPQNLPLTLRPSAPTHPPVLQPGRLLPGTCGCSACGTSGALGCVLSPCRRACPLTKSAHRMRNSDETCHIQEFCNALVLPLCLDVCQDTLWGSGDGSRFCKGFVLRPPRAVSGLAQSPRPGEAASFSAFSGACAGGGIKTVCCTTPPPPPPPHTSQSCTV